MKTTMTKFSRMIFIIILVIASLSLAACSTATQESVPDTAQIQQSENEVVLPVVSSNSGESSETVAEDQVKPEPEQETEDQDTVESPLEEPYPAPEIEDQTRSVSIEAFPEPQEETVQALLPTPRGDDLIATDPASVNLASGQLQLVELFAFW